MSLLLLLGQTAPLLGNPTGGNVVAGAATIGAAGSTLTVSQATQNAIINWQTFSIANGETTKFIVPNSTSATLNRVVGGNPSAIYGNLQSNGILYLVNPSGIVVGPSGRIDTAGFLASTLDVSNQQFLAGGDMNFSGSSGASVNNAGVIHASSGDVYLIANQVNNTGTITAPKGTAGLAAGSDILFQQAGSEHLFVQATPTGTTRATGVTNAGTIRAAAAELKAAGGNAYALAINNTGVVAATGYKKINGQVYLTSDGGSITNSGKISARQHNGNGGKIVLDGTATASATSGTVTNSGTLNASATRAGGKGGTISVKDMTGKTIQSGSIIAKGGQGGTGGSAEVSGDNLVFTGLVDLTAPGGTTGTLLLDPVNLDVIEGFDGNIIGNENDPTMSTIGSDTVDMALSTANITLNADNSITIDSAIEWGGNTLTLSTNNAGSTITVNAALSGGGLVLDAKANTDVITGGGFIEVGTFTLMNGSFVQNQVQSAPNNGFLPIFSAGTFQIEGNSSFLRTTGGDGSAGNPYQIADIYGLQGLGSPSGMYLNSHAVITQDIDPITDVGYTNFIPIGTGAGPFTGSLDGQGHTINQLTISEPTSDEVGLFTDLGAGASISNLFLTNVSISGNAEVGALAGQNDGATISHVLVSGTVTGGTTINNSDNIGGLVGNNNSGTLSNISVSAAVSGADNVGGLAGYNDGSITLAIATGSVTANGSTIGGLIGEDDRDATVSESTAAGTVFGGGVNVGGLIGYNRGLVQTSFAEGAVTADSGAVGGLVGENDNEMGSIATIENCYSIGSVTATGSNPAGGLIGANFGTVSFCYSTGPISGTTVLGGLIALDAGPVSSSFWDTTTTGTTISQGGTGDATSALLDLATYTQQGWDFGTNGTDLSHTWVIFNGQTRPLLSSAYSTTITDEHQLQLIGLNPTTLAATYTLARNIDLTGVTNPSDIWGTSTSNGGAGFVPIGSSANGNSANNFTGTFIGQNFIINGLYINEPTGNQYGLFGVIASSGTVSGIGLTNVQVTGNDMVGGLVGINFGNISDSYITGAVNGNMSTGGLAGYSEGLITTSSSSALVTGIGSSPNGIGGLVGYNNRGTITQSFATGDVNALPAGAFDVGGLAGADDGMISDAYSTGHVTAGATSSSIGGFVGLNNEGTIIDAYTVGAVTVGSNSFSFGAFAGANGTSITNSFYDTSVTGALAAVGSNTGTAAITGATTAQLMQEQFVEDNSPASPTFDFESIWTTNGDTTLPQLIGAAGTVSSGSQTDTLSGTAFADDGTTADADSLINLIIGGSVFGSTTTDSAGDFSFTLSSTALTSGVLLTDPNTLGNTYYQANAPTAAIANINIMGGTLTVMADTASNAALAAVTAGLSANGINYSVNNANALATIEGVNMNIVGGYAFDGNITASGSLITSASSNLTSSQDVTLTGSNVSLSGSLASTAAVNLTSTSGDVVIINLGNSTAATAASMTLTSAGAVSMGNSTISLDGGDFVATGNGSSSDFNGIDMQGVNLVTNGGNINLTGQGILGNIQGLNVAGLGIDIANSVLETAPQFEGDVVHAALQPAFQFGDETPTTGDITINGNGSPGAGVAVTGSLTGVHIDDTSLSVVDGAISITGTVSNGTAATFADGVTIDDFSAVEATGIGTISITGTTLGATASTNVTGVHILDAAVTAVGDSGQTLSGINITGTAGALANEQTRAGAVGIYLFTDTTISATGTAPITLTGFGGTDTDATLSLNAFSNGILFTSQDEGSTSLISTTSGAITLTGTGGISPRFSAGLNLYGPNGATAEVSSTSGAITLDGSIANVPNSTLGIFGDYFQIGSVVTTDSGLISIDGTVHHGGATQTDGQSQGVVFSTATIQSTGNGSISITGDTTGVTGNYQIGGVLAVDTDISSVGGDITINGTTNTTSEVGDELFGINLRGGTTVLAQDGAITMTGTVSSGTADVRDFGIRVSEAATVTALGDITLTGTTAGSTSDEVNIGFIVEGAGSAVTASGGDGLMITGTSGALGGTTGGIVDTSGDNVLYNPGTYGITVADGGALNTLASAPMVLHGTGGANTNTDATAGSSGVAVFSPVAEESSDIDSAGTLTITGTAGSSPSAGFGVLIGGAGNVGDASVSATKDVSITGTGGIGNVAGSILPNAGVGLFNPGNNLGTAEVNSNEGSVTITGTSGGGSVSTGVDLAAYFSAGNNQANASGIGASGTISFVSLSGEIDSSASMSGQSVSFTTPAGTSSSVWIYDGPSVSLSGGDFTDLITGNDVSLGTISVSNLTLNSPGAENHPAVSFGTTTAGSITLNGIGAVTQSGAVATSLLTINDAQSIDLTNSANAINTLGDISSTGAINLVTDPGLTLTGTVTSGAPITLAQSGGPLTLGPNAQIIETGEGNIVLAAGTDLASGNAFINNSTFAGNAIQTGSGVLYVYSSDPGSDVFGGLTFPINNQVFGATFPASSDNFDLPGNAAFFFTGTAQNPPPPNNPPGNTVGSGSTPPSTMTGGAAGSGSNLVPPALTPQSPQVAQANTQAVGGSANTTDSGGAQTPPISFVGTGIASLIGQLDVGLAEAASNGGQINSGDVAQLGNGALSNVTNPQASDAINEALGPIVYQNLSDALKAMGDWADVPDESDNTASGSGGGETILTEGGVAEMTGSQVKNIPLDKAPVELRNAMNGTLLQGAGH